jgi:hypothetical protein
MTLQVYAGVPLTTISKQCGTGLTMIEQHYAGVIESWDGNQVPAEDQLRAAVRDWTQMDAVTPQRSQPWTPTVLQSPAEPTRGLEPRTPSLRGMGTNGWKRVGYGHVQARRAIPRSRRDRSGARLAP